ncbi:unnamed protein product [Paramecium primaurelia]|uniref:Cysteine protease n=1 Tax=Paramecium primaurelia TaxID=5886 RepID=A0A8S1LRG4_PARPR|nr:unnamed protein product [Paramecium primaurelia]
MQYIYGSFIDGWYNLRFFLNSYFQDSEKRLRQISNSIYILNHLINDELEVDQKMEKLKTLFESTIWFSYRTKIPQLQYSTLTSDTGWGCMLRVGQMALCQQIKYFYNLNTQQELTELIQQFADNDEEELSQFMNRNDGDLTIQYKSPFSIQKIVVQTKQELQKLPGEWYKPNDILFVLKYLFRYSKYQKNLRIHINHENAFILSDIISLMFNTNGGDEEWLKEQIQKGQNQSHQFGVSIFILTRIGLETCNPEYLKVLNEIMTYPQFQGILGGFPNKALYILGRVGDYYIYLDPHYVQYAQTYQEMENDKQSYACQNIQLIDRTQLDPSMAISFCVKNALDLLDLWRRLKQSKSENGESFFIALTETHTFYQLAQSYYYGSDEDEIVTILN